MCIVTNPHGKSDFLNLFLWVWFALSNFILRNLGWQAWKYVTFVRIVNQEVCATCGVFEGDTLGGWERGAHFEELLCNILVLASKLVGDADWDRVEFLYFIGSRLDQRIQHRCLESTASCYAVLGIEGTRQFFFAENRL